MARKPRVFVAGGVYHVYNRFASGEAIFSDPNEVVEFVELIRRIKKRDGWTVFAWAIMSKFLKPDSNPNCGQPELIGFDDLNTDGNWDMKTEPVAEYPCRRLFSVDIDFDGQFDLFFSAQASEYFRIHESVRTTAPPIYSVPCEKPIPVARFVANIVCRMPSRVVHEFWRRAFVLEFTDGYDREIAELLAAGILPQTMDDWPDEWRILYRQIQDLSEQTLSGEHRVRVEFWTKTWGHGTTVPKNL
jgi:hypothetical protein